MTNSHELHRGGVVDTRTAVLIAMRNDGWSIEDAVSRLDELVGTPMIEPLRTTESAAAAVTLIKAMRPRPMPGDRVIFHLDQTGFPIDVRIEGPLDLVGSADVAEMAGMSRSSVTHWRRRYQDFPKPCAQPSGIPIWHRADIKAWLAGQERDSSWCGTPSVQDEL